MLHEQKQHEVLDKLYLEYGIIDVYFVKGQLWITNEIDKHGVEKCLTDMNLSVTIKHIGDEVTDYV